MTPVNEETTMRQLQTFCVALIVAAALCPGTARAQVQATTTTDSTAFHVFNTGSSSDLLRVQSNTFVGIGTATPGVLLDLKGDNINQPYGGQLRIQATDFDQISFYNSASAAQNGTNRLGFIYYDITHNVMGMNNDGVNANNTNKYLLLNQTGGYVGIGTLTPLAVLTVQKDNATTFLGLSGDSGGYADISLGRTAAEARLGIAASEVGGGQFAVGAKVGDAILRLDDSSKHLHLLAGSGYPVMTITNTSVGIGTASPSMTLQIKTPGGPNSVAGFRDNPNAPGTVLLDMVAGEVDVSGLRIGASGLADITTPAAQQGQVKAPLYLQYSGGDVEIGSGNHGNLTVHGTVYANYQDVAEWVPASELMPAGTVVVISDETNNTVTASTHAYDTAVAGVVSAAPGLLLGVASDSKAKIATTGRVKVRVDASKGPIQKGDLLVTSDRPGMAMKSEPLDLGGTKIHRPGTLIGKALEPLASGEGEILVLLSLQ
jgi:hypothetical protein